MDCYESPSYSTSKGPQHAAVIVSGRNEPAQERRLVAQGRSVFHNAQKLEEFAGAIAEFAEGDGDFLVLVTGSLKEKGEHVVTLRAKNAVGTAERKWRIVVGQQIALTPPMGWNSWNCFAHAVDEAKVRAAADAMVASGLINHGWTYINIDDCWSIKPGSNDPDLSGAARDADGMINANKKFPDMKALCAYVHGKGLKIGIYSSPGPLTCAGFTASYQHEDQDARRYAEWGFDYLKYDWCSYGRVIRTNKPTHEQLMEPYRVMRASLDKVDRDIVYSLCQYGWGKVWQWGGEVGGNCWRTTDDISDTWRSMAGIGFSQAGHEKYAGPGHGNDPDMLVVGQVGWGRPHGRRSRVLNDGLSPGVLFDVEVVQGLQLDALAPPAMGMHDILDVLAASQAAVVVELPDAVVGQYGGVGQIELPELCQTDHGTKGVADHLMGRFLPRLRVEGAKGERGTASDSRQHGQESLVPCRRCFRSGRDNALHGTISSGRRGRCRPRPPTRPCVRFRTRRFRLNA